VQFTSQNVQYLLVYLSDDWDMLANDSKAKQDSIRDLILLTTSDLLGNVTEKIK
jgi:hypothetical protein